jgi:hypothetical protein
MSAKCRKRKSAGITGVLIDLAVFHDDDQVFARIFQQLDVGNRSPVNQQQVIASQAPLGPAVSVKGGQT